MEDYLVVTKQGYTAIATLLPDVDYNGPTGYFWYRAIDYWEELPMVCCRTWQRSGIERSKSDEHNMG